MELTMFLRNPLLLFFGKLLVRKGVHAPALKKESLTKSKPQD
ncbi:hypothetical protein [Nocardia australiensis]|nr:hypothetical protein [Nocardia australiensis]